MIHILQELAKFFCGCIVIAVVGLALICAGLLR